MRRGEEMIVTKMKLEFSDLTSASIRMKKIFERVSEKKQDDVRSKVQAESRLETMSLGALLYHALVGDGLVL
jgi:hypothetical protein